MRWDGRHEQIVMSLTVRGTAPDAAWIMPVPHRATVELGGSGLFSELAGLTAQGAVRDLAGNGTSFLTAIDQTFPKPELISGDHELKRVAGDSPYQRVTYRYSLLRVGGIPAWILVMGAVFALAGPRP